MAESDDKLSRSYRGLAREEPPAALDAAILAAARESVRPRARNRWTGPVSIAAVLVLGLGVSLRMQTEQPGIETSAPPPSASSAEYPVASSTDTAAPEASAKDSQPEAARAGAVEAPASPAEKNVASTPPVSPQAPGAKLLRDPVSPPEARAKEQASPPPEAPAKKRLDQPATEAARAEAKPFVEPPTPAVAPMSPAAPAPPASPPASLAPLRAKRESAAGVAQDSAKADADERVAELERIARLRRDGRDAEADKALEEFRRRHPDYRIPDAVWERVRPR